MLARQSHASMYTFPDSRQLGNHLGCVRSLGNGSCTGDTEGQSAPSNVKGSEELAAYHSQPYKDNWPEGRAVTMRFKLGQSNSRATMSRNLYWTLTLALSYFWTRVLYHGVQSPEWVSRASIINLATSWPF